MKMQLRGVSLKQPLTSPSLLFLLLLVVLLTSGTNSSTASDNNNNNNNNGTDSTESSRINGGEDAEQGRYDYTVSLHRASDLSLLCGGSLIAPDVVLTAAHCIDPELGELAIRSRPYNLQNPVPESKIFAVAAPVPHPLYNFTRGEFAYDVALLVLDGMSLGQPIVSLNTLDSVPFVGQTLTQMGWGDTSDRERVFPDVLQVFDSAEYISNTRCQTMFDTANPDFELRITDDMMCTIEGRGQGACRGDSGSPLIVAGTTTEEDIQVGIVSFGGSCADPLSPSAFARVSNQYDFVKTTLCEYSQAPPASFGCAPRDATVAPTLAPMAPTVSAAPSVPQVTVTIQLYFSFRPEGASWTIETLDGVVLHKAERGKYANLDYSFVLEQVVVPADTILNFVLVDEFGYGADDYTFSDAAVYLFLGPDPDESKVIGRVEPLPTSSDTIETRVTSFRTSESGILETLAPFYMANTPPTYAPSNVGDGVDVTILIRFDAFPVQTSWRVYDLDSGDTIAEGGRYGAFVGDNTTVTVSVPPDVLIVFAIIDSNEDGMTSGNGESFVFYGSQVDFGQVLVYDDGDFLDSDELVVVVKR